MPFTKHIRDSVQNTLTDPKTRLIDGIKQIKQAQAAAAARTDATVPPLADEADRWLEAAQPNMDEWARENAGKYPTIEAEQEAWALQFNGTEEGQQANLAFGERQEEFARAVQAELLLAARLHPNDPQAIANKLNEINARLPVPEDAPELFTGVTNEVAAEAAAETPEMWQATLDADRAELELAEAERRLASLRDTERRLWANSIESGSKQLVGAAASAAQADFDAARRRFMDAQEHRVALAVA